MSLICCFLGLSVDTLNGESFVSVGNDSQMKHWRCPDVISDSISEPFHSVPLNGVAYGVSHNVKSDSFAICGEEVQIWRPSR